MLSPYTQKNKINSIKLIALGLLYSVLSTTFTHSFYSQFIIPTHQYEENFLKHYENTEDILSALIASGVEPQNYSFYQSEIERWKKDIQESLPANTTETQIAQQIGYYLHDHVYSAYKLSSTTLKEVFETGHFNCLSATILMMIMLKAFGIQVESIILPTHVYTSATLDGKKIEIENTMRDGLAISLDRSVQDRFNRLTGFNYKSNQKKVLINWNETLGLLYSNRSYFDAQKKQYDQAFQNMIKAQVFLANASSEHQNLIAGYLNYSYYIYTQNKASLQEYLKTLSILEEGIQRFPKYNMLKDNYLKGVDRVLEQMIISKASKEDLAHLIQASQPYLTTDGFQKLQKSYFVRMSLHHIRTNQNFDEANYFIKGFWEYNSKDKDAQSLIQEYTHGLVLNDLKNSKRLEANPKILAILDTFPKKLTDESLACYYSGLAKSNYDNKQFENSVQTMITAKEKLGNHYLILQNGFAYSVNSAQHFIDTKNFIKAIEFYKQALSFKKDKNVINNLGILYEQEITNFLKNNKQKAALPLITESKQFTPNHPALRQIHQQY
ncbi:MAG: hypothetical protein ACRCWI_08475 [Brevinema sp.]